MVPSYASAYLHLPIAAFRDAHPDALLGRLTAASQFHIEIDQRGAWAQSIQILRDAIAGLDGHVFMEFDIPRLGSRIDAVVITGGLIFPIEFKVGEGKFLRDDINQVWDYALDLKNFHRASHHAQILPILVATKAPATVPTWAEPHVDGVHPPLCCNTDELAGALRYGATNFNGNQIDGETWGRAPYHPTPTIVQAARALYARHAVESISRNDAGAINLARTSKRVEAVIEGAKKNCQKSIIFVTGVPGAGKTLVGLNVATQRRDQDSPTHAVFLSGNGPLVAVLREALIRDDYGRRKALGERVRKGDVAQKVKPFIQNVHHFRDDGIRDSDSPPADHVVIFDEAQRAWNQTKTSDFMRRRKGLPGFDQSEPQFLIAYMDRHSDWVVIVCLVGGGQEIHTGEAGICAWLAAVREHFPHWQVHVSPRLTDSEYAAVAEIEALAKRSIVNQEQDLHLSVSMRSFRSERVSEFVKLALDCEIGRAQDLLAEVIQQYPMAVTRNLAAAKRWIREHARGSERFGLVASSQAARLKPHAIDVRIDVDPVQWFLNDPDDTRSSYYLEDAATEFQIQGLELDWTCMTWDADLRFSPMGWGHHQFRGMRWERVRNADRQRYLVNAYRVLLTRARQGMVIFVPTGSPSDPTRQPGFYDSTFQYLFRLGLPVLE
ncbi:MAG: DUF2075 domain-containing protein [Rhodocyclaceae bacterium]|nr:DUF2075 domain-containing protein [Rhodocyclaceae bacterium]